MDPILIALLIIPFAGAILCGLLPRGARQVAIATVLFAAACACLLVGASAGLAVESRLGTLPWLPGALGRLPMFGFLLDPLGSVVLLLVIIVGTMVTIFSTEYISEENAEHAYGGGDNRYYFWLLACLGAMIGLVLSPNLLQMFIFWEMTTVCSWALISHAHTEVTQRAGMKALLLKHLGGISFLVALCLLFAFAGGFEFGSLAHLAPGLAAAVFLLLLVAAWAEGAQVPFHTWLPDAHTEAPSPVSAALSGLMVKPAILLLARVLISSWQAPAGLAVVVAIAAMVSILMAIMSYFRQDDLKRLLAYSTIAHLGYMFVGIALGVWGSTIGFQGGVLHVLCHGVAKGTLFLAVGAIAYGAGTRRISELRGLAGKMPLETLAFMVGVLAVTGVPPFATFWSKFMIFSGALQSPGGVVLLVLLATESVVSFSWLLYVAHRVFLGAPSPAAAEAADAPPWMSVALVVGIVFCVLAPLFGLPLVNFLLR